MGVNLAGGEFGSVPGQVDKDFTYPTTAELDYYKSKNLMLIRLPFLWERLQPGLNGPLDAAQIARVQAVLDAAGTRGMKVMLDAHDYGRYNGNLIGTLQVPNAAFKDFWSKMAAVFRGHKGLYGYDLMNEPHDTGGLWFSAAQAGVDGVRATDQSSLIVIEGEGWSGAWKWPANNADLSIRDPANNYMFQAHQYFDSDGSGTYTQNYDADGATAMIGAERVQPFIDWLHTHHYRGMVGEYGVPDNDARWNIVLENFLKSLNANCIPGTYWAGGPWWGAYSLAVEPVNGNDRPQMAVLENYTGDSQCQQQ
jgi:endoglucanase